MNILFIERFLLPSNGGIERVTNILGSYLHTKGLVCHYLFCSKDYSEIPIENKIQIKSYYSYFHLRPRLIKYVKEKNIDVIIVQQIFSDALWFVLKELKSRKMCKIVTCFHLSPNICLFQSRNNKLSKREILYKITGIFPISFIDIVRKYYEISNSFVLLSDSFKEDFIKYYHLKHSDKLVAIPNPCTYKNNISIENIQYKKKQILIVSRFWEKQKNICSALRIWKNIENFGVNDWNLVIAGDGQDGNMIKQYAKNLDLKYCKFVGAVSEPQALYEESRIFMMTSNFEGFGMTLLEAMQNGCVPIAYDTFSTLHDIIRDSYDGFIIKSNQEHTYTDKIIQLMGNDTLCKSMAIHAVESSKRFNQENIANKWIGLLSGIVVH